jgi:hypothetical protein
MQVDSEARRNGVTRHDDAGLQRSVTCTHLVICGKAAQG